MLRRISSYVVYPAKAEKNWEGVVKVKFILTPDGQVKDITVVGSSGYPLLDEAAIQAIKNASPYPFPTTLNQELELTVPINFAKASEIKPWPKQKFPPKPNVLQKFHLLPKYESPAPPAPYAVPVLEPAKPKPEELPYAKMAGTSPVTEKLTPPNELPRFIDFALKSNQPTEVARQEIELAQLKVTEALRNLYPKLKLAGYDTKGEVFKVPYEEYEVKAEIAQPLYYGGRLKDTYNQAKANLEITRRNYDRLKFDVMHKTETAYYNLVAAKYTLAQKQKVEQEAKDLIEKVEKLAKEQMIIPLEAASAQAWFKQFEFQLEGIKHDLSIAELTFQQVLNSRETPEIKSLSLEPERVKLDLNNCLEIALKNRPEIYLSQLLVKFNDYGRKIDSAKTNRPTFDLVSSYGKYQGHFTTEPWRPADNWYVGVKGTVPFGANTVNSEFTSDASQPRFGQTSPTKSTTYSGEFNLLDDIKRLSDKKRSEIDFNRSISDLNETTKTVSFEVKDAFLNYQKAAFQLDTAKADMDFRRSELDIIKIRAMTGEGTISNALEALFNYSEAQTRYLQALANSRIFLVNLKKACGYGLKI